MSKVKLVAFDLDGTIGDTIPLCIRSFKKAVIPYIGHELSDDDVIQTFGLNEQGMIGSIIDTLHKESALEDFYTIYKNLHEQMCPRPFPGIRKLITDLKQSGIIVALITGKGSKSCDITLQQFDMNTLFDKVLTGNEVRNIKADSLKWLLQSYHLSPCEVVYIGDTIADIKACKAIGVDCLSAAWGVPEKVAQDLVRHNKNIFYDIPSLYNHLLTK
ncbi:HAD family hydrolase [Bacteroides ilei]|uniref:HAD family hydrolase n=1 Tax=Bacteroides ilei TaxID=1907658 RepID=UPI0009308B37|nr:HAD hydrolase-like protein [Bacteroides ilei]MDY3069425.1 HAD hydrolase-like protein [Parabacteroides sp.]